ncbi:MAG: hypothetical protein U1C74_04075, partial [Phenylobacterium sp.]|nr:hypothetical protein [Phenylobacterium sp.]
YFALLDGRIRRASDGRRSVDDLVREMVRRHRGGEAVSEADWLDLIRVAAGDEAVTIHKSMLVGGVIVPESGDFGPCFRRYATKVRRYELGFTAKTMPERRAEVTQLVEGSEAAKAGLRNGDVVAMPVLTTEGVRRDPERTVTMAVKRGEQTFEVTYLPRGDAFDTWQWERVPGVPESACRP